MAEATTYSAGQGAPPGPNPTVTYQEVQNAIPVRRLDRLDTRAATADLTGNGLPDLYIANDFGPGHLLTTTPRPEISSSPSPIGQRTPTTPKSFVVGKGSFKGMGVDFGDLSDNGKFDFMVSNITTAWGLEESNFVFMNNASSGQQMQQDLASGYAPFTQDAEQLGMALTGWAWDVKMGDFLNSGNLDVVQTDGFIKGTINRWNWLQEMAMTNDDLLSNPADWPLVQAGDDIAGQPVPGLLRQRAGRRLREHHKQLGLCSNTTPTRGVATADTRADGQLDFAVARQWGPPAFYANQSPDLGQLPRPPALPACGGRRHAGPGPGRRSAARPYGTTVQISTPGHTQISQLDGGSGSGGKRSFEVSFGLGSYHGPVTVQPALARRERRVPLRRPSRSPQVPTTCSSPAPSQEVPSS